MINFHIQQVQQLSIDKNILENQADTLKAALQEVNKEIKIVTKQIETHERFIMRHNIINNNKV